MRNDLGILITFDAPVYGVEETDVNAFTISYSLTAKVSSVVTTSPVQLRRSTKNVSTGSINGKPDFGAGCTLEGV